MLKHLYYSENLVTRDEMRFTPSCLIECGSLFHPAARFWWQESRTAKVYAEILSPVVSYFPVFHEFRLQYSQQNHFRKVGYEYNTHFLSVLVFKQFYGMKLKDILKKAFKDKDH